MVGERTVVFEYLHIRLESSFRLLFKLRLNFLGTLAILAQHGGLIFTPGVQLINSR